VCFTWAGTLPAEWPAWRGPNYNGVAKTGAPVEFSVTKNLAWKAEIPGRGHSSPVLWGDKVFLTTAVPVEAAAPAPQAADGGRRGPGGGAGLGVEHKFLLLCLDRNTGKILWQAVAKTAKPHEGYHGRYGSFASGSPVTDGKHVYAFFGSRGVFCYTLEGKLVWQKDFEPMTIKLGFGEGTAPVIEQDRLILNFDHEGGSYVVVLDKSNGREIWRMNREEGSAWSSPLVVEHGGSKQVVISATKKVRSYDFRSGELIWECVGLGGNVILMPVSHSGIVYVMSGFRDPKLLAIRLGKQGDLTGTDAIVWSATRGLSYTPSPVLDDNKLYLLTDSGMLSCLNATTGEPYYQQQRLPKTYSFKASPVAAGGKLYLASENGDVVVVRAGEKFEVLATNTFADEFFVASPAVAGGALFLRGRNTLYSFRE
jgi:outer membrane protein assembly factor BamB